MLRLATATVMIGFAMLFLNGCGPQRASVPADDGIGATPTWEPVATFTPTPVPVETPTAPSPQAEPTVIQPSTETVIQPVGDEEPADEDAVALMAGETVGLSEELAADAEPTVTPNAEPALTVNAAMVNVRRGPGTEYDLVGTAVQDAQFPVTGRNEQGDWWQVCCFDGRAGWLYGPLVDVHDSAGVTVATDITPPPALAAPPQPAPVEGPIAVVAPAQQEASADEPIRGVAEPAPAAPIGTAGNFDPNAQYQIVHYRVLGFDDNNGGIFSKGSQQLIFVTVLDENGQGVDDAVVKDAVDDSLNVITGSKGPGKAEIKMDWEPYKLYVAADSSGPVTSQVSNQMNNPYPHIPDIIGLLGPPDNEYAICPTGDDRCSPPFYHAHWSYEITFQKVK